MPERGHRRGTRQGTLAGLVGVLVIATGFGGSVHPPISLASFNGADSSAIALATDTLNPPSGLVAVGGLTIALAWTPTADTYATGYEVWRATSSGGTYALVTDVSPRTTAALTDSPAVGTWYYVLRSYYQSWRSANSNEASAIVSLSSSTGPKACLGASNAADTGGHGDGYESNPGRACVDDSSVAVDADTGVSGHSSSCANAANDRHRYWGYAFGLPGSVTLVKGITVRADMGMNNAGGASNLCVELSWNGGSSWTAPKSVALTQAAEKTYTIGSAADTWGRIWNAADFSTANFRVRLTDATGQPNKNYELDYLAVDVSYTP